MKLSCNYKYRIIVTLLFLARFTHGNLDVNPASSQNPASVSEWSVTETGLVDIHCTDSTSGTTQSCTCSVKSTSPGSGPFVVQQKNGDPFFRVYYTGTGLMAGGTIYTVNVACTDGQFSNSTSVTVNVLANLPPYFNVYPSVTASSVSARSTNVGSTVHTLVARDPESNAITYNMTQSPNLGYFDVNAVTGQITVAKNLQTYTGTGTYTLTVYACDIKECGRSLLVYVPITDLNTAPTFTNLNATVYLLESSVGGTTIRVLTVTDAENDPVTPDCSVSPADEKDKFLLETNSMKLKLATFLSGQTLLDYDKGTTKYLVICTATDGYLTSTSTLTVSIQNVNEAPVFPQTMYYCSLDESAAGVSRCNLGLSATDPDDPTLTGQDKIKYSLLAGNNSQRFSYLDSPDQLTFAVNYDVDSSAMPQNVILTVVAKDAQGLTGTSQVSITVNDVNDNACKFSNKIMSSTVTQGTALGTLGTFVATDADLTSPNKDVTYEVAGGDSSYMYVFSSGAVQYSQLIPESDHGRTFYLLVKCVDGGTPSLSATATYALTYVTTTTSTTTTTTTTTTTPTTTTTATTTAKSDSVWDNDAFVAVFAVLMALLGLALAALLTWLLCCGGCGACGAGSCATAGGQNSCCYPQERPQFRRVKPARDEYDLQPRDREPYRGPEKRISDSGRYSDLSHDSLPVSPSGIRALPAPYSRAFY